MGHWEQERSHRPEPSGSVGPRLRHLMVLCRGTYNPGLGHAQTLVLDIIVLGPLARPVCWCLLCCLLCSLLRSLLCSLLCCLLLLLAAFLAVLLAVLLAMLLVVLLVVVACCCCLLLLLVVLLVVLLDVVACCCCLLCCLLLLLEMEAHPRPGRPLRDRGPFFFCFGGQPPSAVVPVPFQLGPCWTPLYWTSFFFAFGLRGLDSNPLA